MWWAEFYGALTLVTFYVAYKSQSKTAGLALGGLVMWFGLANVLNVPGIVDRDKLVMIDIALSFYCLSALYLKWSRGLAVIFIIAVTAGFWSLYAPEAIVKGGKNALFLLGLSSIWALTRTYWPSSRSSFL